MTDIQKRLYELRDEKYAEFQSKLTPGIPRETFIGVRVPAARTLAKELLAEGDQTELLTALPHETYDENMLHGLLLSGLKDYGETVSLVDAFLPYVDNWAVCDIMSPKCFKKHKAELLEKIKEWSKSDLTYTVRFGLEMLMSHFLDEDYKCEYLDIPLAVKSDEYYVNMMVAWFFATALAKQWESAVVVLEKHLLPDWTHKKTIQKACESYRITDEQKKYLRSLL